MHDDREHLRPVLELLSATLELWLVFLGFVQVVCLFEPAEP